MNYPGENEGDTNLLISGDKEHKKLLRCIYTLTHHQLTLHEHFFRQICLHTQAVLSKTILNSNLDSLVRLFLMIANVLGLEDCNYSFHNPKRKLIVLNR